MAPHPTTPPSSRVNRSSPRSDATGNQQPGNAGTTSNHRNNKGPQQQQQPQQQQRHSFRTLCVGFLLGVLAARAAIALFQTEDDFRQFQQTTMTTMGEGYYQHGLETSLSQKQQQQQQQPHTEQALPLEFIRHEGVVIATKIHGERSVSQLQQSLCLLTAAYNNRVNYDIVVFTTMALPTESIQVLESTVAPAKLTVVVDNPGVQQMVQELSPERQAHLLARCGKSMTLEKLSWSTPCQDGNTKDPLSYNWQAEFRALHLWSMPALANYRYMLWLDSDGFCTQVWDRDPIDYMIQHQLVLFFDHFPMGRSIGADFQDRFIRAFHTTLCKIGMTDDGRLYTHMGLSCPKPVIHQVHGFFHITDLNFYRSDKVMKWANILVGESKFSRRYDDQIGVTVPAAVWAPNQTAELRSRGFDFNVFHNGRLHGMDWAGGKDFVTEYWPQNGTRNFPQAMGKCTITNAG